MTRPAPRSVGTPHVKELISQRHVLSRNVSDLLRTAPPLAVVGMPRPPLAARFRLKGSRRHQETDVGGYPAHVVLCGHGEAHSPCGISCFLLESLVDGRAQRLGIHGMHCGGPADMW